MEKSVPSSVNSRTRLQGGADNYGIGITRMRAIMPLSMCSPM